MRYGEDKTRKGLTRGEKLFLEVLRGVFL